MKKYLLIFALSFLLVNSASAEVISIVSRPSTIEEKIQAEFQDTPEMHNIVQCESHFNQFDPRTGKPLLSKTSDVGVMQVNQVHWKRAKLLGFDIFNSVDDNIAMGKIILKEQGITAWEALKSDCYKKLLSLN